MTKKNMTAFAYLKSGNAVNLGLIKVSEEDFDSIINVVAKGVGWISWGGYILRSENIEAFRVEEVENDTK